MIARFTGGILLGLGLCLLGVQAGEDKFARQKEKDALVEPKKDDPAKKERKAVPKAEKKDTDSVSGKVKSVNATKGSFTLSPEDGKDRVFLVTDTTKFLGPRGGDRGTGREGLKDETMSAGHIVRVVPATDGKNAAEVHLPVRKAGK